MLELQGLQRIWCLAKFELVRLFMTKRGALALAAFVTVWLFILYYAIGSAVEYVSSKTTQTIGYTLLSAEGMDKLLNWPVAELIVYWVLAMYSFPMFSLIASSDQTCTDRTRGTLRFISLRVTRAEILLGRFLGQVLILAVLIAVTLIATLSIAAYRDPSLLLVGMGEAFYVYKNILIAVLPFIALTSFFNSFTRSSRLVVIVTLLFFTIIPLIIAFIEYKLGMNTYLSYILPGGQISDVINQKELFMSNYVVPVMQMCGYLFLGHIVMKRSSL
ncbi:MAG: ABC transporter permease subunit [Alteromonadaceae bacterium]|nr:ABC transporter permease subunit [Alteromonadaceae bacterium]